MINQAPIVCYTASVSEKFFPNFWRKTFSAESIVMSDSYTYQYHVLQFSLVRPFFCLFVFFDDSFIWKVGFDPVIDVPTNRRRCHK